MSLVEVVVAAGLLLLLAKFALAPLSSSSDGASVLNEKQARLQVASLVLDELQCLPAEELVDASGSEQIQVVVSGGSRLVTIPWKRTLLSRTETLAQVRVEVGEGRKPLSLTTRVCVLPDRHGEGAE